MRFRHSSVFKVLFYHLWNNLNSLARNLVFYTLPACFSFIWVFFWNTYFDRLRTLCSWMSHTHCYSKFLGHWCKIWTQWWFHFSIWSLPFVPPYLLGTYPYPISSASCPLQLFVDPFMFNVSRIINKNLVIFYIVSSSCSKSRIFCL